MDINEMVSFYVNSLYVTWLYVNVRFSTMNHENVT